MSREIL
jgi:hypothetical protein